MGGRDARTGSQCAVCLLGGMGHVDRAGAL